MRYSFRLRRGTPQVWTSVNPILANGEPGLEDNGGGYTKLKFGNGVARWNDLPYYSSGSSDGGITDHSQLTGRNAPNQHDIPSVTGLGASLDSKETPLGAQAKVNTLDASLAIIAKTGSYIDLVGAPAGGIIVDVDTPSLTWILPHNITHRPNVTLINSAGDEFTAERIQHLPTSVVVTLLAAQAGKAILSP